MPAHVLAASSAICKDMFNRLKVQHVETNEYEAVFAGDQQPSVALAPVLRRTTVHDDTANHSFIDNRSPDFCLPLQELNVLINGSIKAAAILDTGSQIVVIRHNIAQALRARINHQRLIKMEGANGATNWTIGCAENLTLQVGDALIRVHAHVVEQASFKILLGRPFQKAAFLCFEDLPSGDVEVSVCDPANLSRRVYLSTRPRAGRVLAVKVISVHNQAPLPTPSAALDATPPSFPSLLPTDPSTLVLKYKRIAQKVQPVAATLPKEFRNICCIPVDPLLSLPPLPMHPPDFTPGERLTQECLDALKLNANDFLWPEEVKLICHVLILNEKALVWTEVERGRFSDEYFSPVKIPVIEHTPWAHKNLPIPPGILQDVIKLFRKKLAAGVYEHSDLSYCLQWFCVEKKSSALCIVHDLQPLNTITIRNLGVPPIADQVIESMAGRSCYSMLDLYTGYNHCTLNVASRDLTTVQSPVGSVRLTTVPQGWTDAVPIFHGDVVFILKEEIPDPAMPLMDNTSIKGPPTRYELEGGGYETIPTNLQIRCFIWEHIGDVHRILHRFLCAGATISTAKLFIAVPKVVILGHKCNYEGRIPDDSKIDRIRNWPACKNLSDVRAFLGITGYLRIWIKDYSAIAHLLINLTRKDVPFAWQAPHEQAMQSLKNAIVESSVLISLDYTTDRTVYLSVDSSIHGIGWILAQDCADGRRRPLRFGSILWNECELHYSQAKIELYGLFRALCAARLYLIGARNLIVEVDASYIKGMLRNPDIQPNAAINQWIAAILLFNFKLVHVPADKHKGPDGLSRRKPAPGEEETDDPEDWVDTVLALGTWVVSWLDAFPTDAHHTDALVLSFEANDDDNPAQLSRPRRNRHLPTQYCTGDFITSDTPCAPSHHRPLITDTSQSTPDTYLEDTDINSGNNNVNNNNLVLNNSAVINGNNNNNNNIVISSNNIINDPDFHSDTPQAPDSSDADSDTINPALVKFSTSDKASKADAEIERICQYLLSWCTPSDLPADVLTHFISRAYCFLIAEG